MGSVHQGGLLRVNVGNCHFMAGDFGAATKMYRMALDQLPPADRQTRAAVLCNIGAALSRMERYQVTSRLACRQTERPWMATVICDGQKDRQTCPPVGGRANGRGRRTDRAVDGWNCPGLSDCLSLQGKPVGD
jgi:hypothetical protein